MQPELLEAVGRALYELRASQHTIKHAHGHQDITTDGQALKCAISYAAIDQEDLAPSSDSRESYDYQRSSPAP